MYIKTVKTLWLHKSKQEISLIPVFLMQYFQCTIYLQNVSTSCFFKQICRYLYLRPLFDLRHIDYCSMKRCDRCLAFEKDSAALY